MKKISITDENCFYGFRDLSKSDILNGFIACPCAICEHENLYYLCRICDMQHFFPIADPFGSFDAAVSYAYKEFGKLRFQRISMDDFSSIPDGFWESMGVTDRDLLKILSMQRDSFAKGLPDLVV